MEKVFPELKRTAIEGTTKFEGYLTGTKTFTEMSVIKLILGVFSVFIGII